MSQDISANAQLLRPIPDSALLTAPATHEAIRRSPTGAYCVPTCAFTETGYAKPQCRQGAFAICADTWLATIPSLPKLPKTIRILDPLTT